jgi:NhaP-type Na+/H+ or K+/H+ antiporter
LTEGLAVFDLVTTLALVGGVIVVATLVSGATERTGVPQVAIFLALGAALGPLGAGVFDVGLDSQALRVVATLSLALILFTDALSLDLREVRRHGALALAAVGPGTLLSAALYAALGVWLLDFSLPAAAILGASVASTDPVLLKGLLRRRDLPKDARQALRLESGTNDVVLLPIVLVAIAVLLGGGREGVSWTAFVLDLFVLGPGAGVAAGLVGLGALQLARKRIGVRRDYESLYSLGVAFAAYAAAEAMHGSGFLACFAAGLTIAAFDVELCDCFREYGETTAELALLLSFVLFGSSLIWTGLASATLPSFVFALLVLAGRPLVFRLTLAGSWVDPRSRRLVAWFGPRGLSSLLLVLLPVFAGAPGATALFEATSLVVLLSVLLHGGALVWLSRRAEPPLAAADPEADMIRIDELRALRDTGAALALLDVRRQQAWDESSTKAADAQRLSPERGAAHAAELGLPRDAWLVLYCTCPAEETSGRVARELKRSGWPRARALVGGLDAWQSAGLPMESKPWLGEL